MAFVRLLPRAVLQRLLPARRQGLTDYYVRGFEGRQRSARWQLRHMEKASRVLEIGCGRDLHASLIAAIEFGKQVIAFDVARLAELDIVNFTLGRLGKAAIGDLRELERFGIEYVVAEDIRRVPGTYDGVMSTASLEHVPQAALESLVETISATLPVGGVFTAEIDYVDHWSYVGQVPPWNFYTLTDLQFTLLNNARMHQNRLRHGDYTKLLERSGFRQVACETRHDMGEIDMRSLGKRFLGYDRDDLDISSALLAYARH